MTYLDQAEFREIADSITPHAVAQFLATHQWELEAEKAQIRQLWRLIGENGQAKARIMLPLASDFVDFQRRFEETLATLGRVHSLNPVQLYEKIMGSKADLFYVRLDQEMIDGTIPFKQAEETIQALYKMMRAAASTAADPFRPQRGRPPAMVSEFLQEDVRLGHTKKGSFIFTLVARHGETAPPSNPEEHISPFSRQVMETLARGLETTKGLTQELNQETIESPSSSGVSTGLVSSLDEIGQSENLRKVELSFNWSTSEPQPDVGLGTIEFDRESFEQLAGIRERLIQRDEPSRRVTLVGSVRTLRREDEIEGEEESAAIELVADVDGKQRTLRMILSGEDHDWAIAAYQKKFPFTVTGDLTFERRSWHLKNPEVDPSYFRFRNQITGQIRAIQESPEEARNQIDKDPE